MSKKALVVGATGLVGKALVDLLLRKDYYEEIIVLTRRETGVTDSRLKTVLIDNFDNLADFKDQMNAHDIYCSIGTTRKKAGSKEAFLKIDFEYPMELARLTMVQPDFQQFLLVSSLGANADSPLFYNETKGKLEDALIALDMKALKIFQPSLLLGKRDEFRPLEEVGKFFSAVLSFFVVGSKKRLWSIKDEEVADSMYQVAKKNEPGFKRYKPNDMLRMIYSW
ncbi:MAG: NAD-dependent epimerase/dehydratase family protein [Cyclobacteriaceae bacterium]